MRLGRKPVAPAHILPMNWLPGFFTGKRAVPRYRVGNDRFPALVDMIALTHVCSYNVVTLKGSAMATDSIVRARIDAATKMEAAAVLAGMGMSVSDAIRILLTKVAREHTLPFDVRPNADTIAAMEEARRGNLPSFATVTDLMADLNRAED